MTHHRQSSRRASRSALAFLPLLLAVLVPAGAGADEVQEYMRAQAMVNWTDIVPAQPLRQKALARSFTARVRRSGKLQSLGLPVRIGDIVDATQQGPYIWELSTRDGRESIRINTYDIPAQFYPSFQ
jgi:hypothetical protein